MRSLMIVFAICLVGALALTDMQKETLRQHKDACLKETGVDPGDVEKIEKGEWVDNDKLRCFSACMLKRLGLLTEEGKLDEAVARTKMANALTPEKVEEVLMKCKDLEGANTCETGHLLLKCYTEASGKNLLTL